MDLMSFHVFYARFVSKTTRSSKVQRRLVLQMNPRSEILFHNVYFFLFLSLLFPFPFSTNSTSRLIDRLPTGE